MNQSLLLILVFLLIYLPMVAYTYGRQQRWLGAVGWIVLMGGILLAIAGGGGLFPWAGLLWATVAAFGALMIIMDVVEQRHHR
jgi:hypothetical protein